MKNIKKNAGAASETATMAKLKNHRFSQSISVMQLRQLGLHKSVVRSRVLMNDKYYPRNSFALGEDGASYADLKLDQLQLLALE